MLNLAQIYKFLAARYDRLERRAVIVDRSRSIFTTPCVLNPNLIDAIFFFFQENIECIRAKEARFGFGLFLYEIFDITVILKYIDY